LRATDSPAATTRTAFHTVGRRCVLSRIRSQPAWRPRKTTRRVETWSGMMTPRGGPRRIADARVASMPPRRASVRPWDDFRRVSAPPPSAVRCRSASVAHHGYVIVLVGESSEPGAYQRLSSPHDPYRQWSPRSAARPDPEAAPDGRPTVSSPPSRCTRSANGLSVPCPPPVDPEVGPGPSSATSTSTVSS